jgi:2,4-dienoyl-CoA reductase-like NADH-dependent reductase (Old Yellow Enzyme family)
MILKPIKINKILLKNRFVVSPMCQYSAKNGCPTKWHYKHLDQLASTGAGLLMIECTSINKSGRISNNDLCLFNRKQELELKKLIIFLKKNHNVKIGLQISHSGRKGSAELPWIKKNSPLKNKKWLTYAPSPIKKDKNWPVPKELTIKKIEKIKKDFKNCANRAKRIGVDCLELHMAHGYLLHQFFSNISNIRVDQYGGCLKNRSKFLIQVAETIREVWPKDRILGARVTGSDRLNRGLSLNESIFFCKELEKIGLDYVCVSSGGILPKTNIKFKKGYNLDLAKNIKKKLNILVRCSGHLDDYNFACKLIKKKVIDLVAIGRGFIKNKNLILTNSKKNMNNEIPNQYKRCF